jgi:hypothetical protein
MRATDRKEVICVSIEDEVLWRKTLSDGSTLEGVRGGLLHKHEFSPGLGHIRIQETGEKVSFNTYSFNDAVDRLLPPNLRR